MGAFPAVQLPRVSVHNSIRAHTSPSVTVACCGPQAPDASDVAESAQRILQMLRDSGLELDKSVKVRLSHSYALI